MFRIKPIFILLFLINLSNCAKAQFPNQIAAGNANTESYQIGSIGTGTGIHFRYNFPDSATANLSFIKNIPNFLVIINDTLRKRNNNATKWETVGSGSGGIAGTVTSVSGLSPLFFVSNPTTTATFFLNNTNAYTLFGRGSGTGVPSYLNSIDSNWIPVLHSENYYNTKYLPIGTIFPTYYNSNIGIGYRWAVPNTNNVKTVFNSFAFNWDSTSNVNGLTPKIDTSLLATIFHVDSLSQYQTLQAVIAHSGLLELPVNNIDIVPDDGILNFRMYAGAKINFKNYDTGDTLISLGGGINSRDIRLPSLDKAAAKYALRINDDGKITKADTSLPSAPINLGNSDLTQTDILRTYDGDGNELLFDNLSQTSINSALTTINGASTHIIAGAQDVFLKDTGAVSKRISYNSNIHSTFTPYSLVDKSYSDSSSRIQYFTTDNYNQYVIPFANTSFIDSTLVNQLQTNTSYYFNNGLWLNGTYTGGITGSRLSTWNYGFLSQQDVSEKLTFQIGDSSNDISMGIGVKGSQVISQVDQYALIRGTLGGSITLTNGCDGNNYNATVNCNKGDYIELQLIQQLDSVNVFYRNITTGEAVKITRKVAYFITADLASILGYPSIYFAKGNIRLITHTINSQDADYYFIGNSITANYRSGINDSGFVNMLRKQTNARINNMARSGTQTADYMFVKNDFNIHNKIIFMSGVFGNDLAVSFNLATTKARYQALRNNFVAKGNRVVHIDNTFRTTLLGSSTWADLNAINLWLDSTYRGIDTIIHINDVLSYPADFADGVHPTTGGHFKIFNKILHDAAPLFELQDAGKLTVVDTLYYKPSVRDTSNKEYKISWSNFQSKLSGTGYAKFSGTTPSYISTIPIADGGTNNGSLSVTNGSLVYADGTKLVSLPVGTAGQHLVGGTIPVWRDTAVAGSGLTIGTTTITSGTNTRILYDNAGVLGEYTTTGSGTSVALAASPALTGTPTAPTASTGTNTTQLATTAFLQSEKNNLPVYTTTGTNTAYILTPSPALGAYAVGITYQVFFNVASGTNPTINVSGLGAKSLTKSMLGIGTQDLSALERIYTIIYDGTNFEVVNFGFRSTGTGSNVLATNPALVTPNLGVASATSIYVSNSNAISSGQYQNGSNGSAQPLLVYRTTNGGSDITPLIFTGLNLATAGTLSCNIDKDNGVVFTAKNGTRSIARAGVNITNLVNTAGAETGDLIFSTKASAAGMAERMRIDSAGNVGIGTTSPTAQLHATSTIRFSAFGAGALVADGSGNITSSSDFRVKHDIVPFYAGLDEIKNIHPSSFIYNMDVSNTRMPGFIAQDIQQAFGGIGIGHDSQGMLSLNTNVITAALVNSVKQLSDKIDKLQKQIDNLKLNK